MYVLATEGHMPLCAALTKTNEHKAWSGERGRGESCFAGEEGGGGVK